MARVILCTVLVLGICGPSFADRVPATRPAPEPAKEGEAVKVDEKSGKITIKADGKNQDIAVSETAVLLDAKGDKLKSLTDVKGAVKYWLGKDGSISKLQLVK